jgi:hypothetical protein
MTQSWKGSQLSKLSFPRRREPSLVAWPSSPAEVAASSKIATPLDSRVRGNDEEKGSACLAVDPREDRARKLRESARVVNNAALIHPAAVAGGHAQDPRRFE